MSLHLDCDLLGLDSRRPRLSANIQTSCHSSQSEAKRFGAAGKDDVEADGSHSYARLIKSLQAWQGPGSPVRPERVGTSIPKQIVCRCPCRLWSGDGRGTYMASSCMHRGRWQGHQQVANPSTCEHLHRPSFHRLSWPAARMDSQEGTPHRQDGYFCISSTATVYHPRRTTVADDDFLIHRLHRLCNLQRVTVSQLVHAGKIVVCISAFESPFPIRRDGPYTDQDIACARPDDLDLGNIAPLPPT